jgi:hypothetical protein
MTNLSLVEKGQNKSGDLFSKFRFLYEMFPDSQIVTDS